MLAHTIWLLPPILAIVGGAWLLVPARGAHRWRARVMPWVEPATSGVNRRSLVSRVLVAQRLRTATAAQRLAVGGSCALAMLVAGLTHRPLVAVPLFVVSLCTAQMMAKGIARSTQVRAQAHMSAEMAVAAELLALLVSAGMSVEAALRCLPDYMVGEVASTIAGAVEQSVPEGLRSPRTTNTFEVRGRTRLGDGSALAAMTEVATRCEPARGLLDALAICHATGAPVAQVLTEQATHIRAQVRAQTLARAGRRDVLMLVPVVFLVFPAVVLVAVFPGWQELTRFGW